MTLSDRQMEWLRGAGFRQLEEALTHSFPLQPDVARVVQYVFDKPLDVVVGKESVKNLWLTILQKALPEGGVRVWNLLDEARRQRPGNDHLRRFFVALDAIDQARPEDRVRAEEVDRLRKELNDLVAELDDQRARGDDTAATARKVGAKKRELRQLEDDLRRLRENDYLGEEIGGAGRFKLLNPLGSGGVGTVWRAFDRKLLTHVAVKVLERDEFEERFRRGARTMSMLRGVGGIVGVRELTQSRGGHTFFVMDLVEGSNFEDAVLEQRLNPRDALKALVAVATTLDSIHAKDVVHRDIKPSNILVPTSGAPLLTDFDVVWAPDTVGATRSPLGTQFYMPPELADAPDQASPALDIYSLGMTAIFALSRKHPTAQRPSVLAPSLDYFHCPDAIGKVLLKAIAPAAKDRYASASEFADALTDALIDLRADELERTTDPLVLLEVIAGALEAELKKPSGPAQVHDTISRLCQSLGFSEARLPDAAAAPWDLAFELCVKAPYHLGGLVRLSKGIGAAWPDAFQRYYEARRGSSARVAGVRAARIGPLDLYVAVRNANARDLRRLRFIISHDRIDWTWARTIAQDVIWSDELNKDWGGYCDRIGEVWGRPLGTAPLRIPADVWEVIDLFDRLRVATVGLSRFWAELQGEGSLWPTEMPWEERHLDVVLALMDKAWSRTRALALLRGRTVPEQVAILFDDAAAIVRRLQVTPQHLLRREPDYARRVRSTRLLSHLSLASVTRSFETARTPAWLFCYLNNFSPPAIALNVVKECAAWCEARRSIESALATHLIAEYRRFGVTHAPVPKHLEVDRGFEEEVDLAQFAAEVGGMLDRAAERPLHDRATMRALAEVAEEMVPEGLALTVRERLRAHRTRRALPATLEREARNRLRERLTALPTERFEQVLDEACFPVSQQPYPGANRSYRAYEVLEVCEANGWTDALVAALDAIAPGAAGDS